MATRAERRALLEQRRQERRWEAYRNSIEGQNAIVAEEAGKKRAAAERAQRQRYFADRGIKYDPTERVDPGKAASFSITGRDGKTYGSAHEYNHARGTGVPASSRADVIRKRYGLDGKATSAQTVEAINKQLEKLGAGGPVGSTGFSQIVDELFQAQRQRSNEKEARNRLAVLNAASNGLHDSKRSASVTDLVGGYGGVKFSGPGGMPYTLPRGAMGAIPVKALGEMRRRAAIEGAAYKALQEQSYQQRQKEQAARADFIFHNYNDISREARRRRIEEQKAQLRGLAEADLEYAQDNLLRGLRSGTTTWADTGVQAPAEATDRSGHPLVEGYAKTENDVDALTGGQTGKEEIVQGRRVTPAAPAPAAPAPAAPAPAAPAPAAPAPAAPAVDYGAALRQANADAATRGQNYNGRDAQDWHRRMDRR